MSKISKLYNSPFFRSPIFPYVLYIVLGVASIFVVSLIIRIKGYPVPLNETHEVRNPTISITEKNIDQAITVPATDSKKAFILKVVQVPPPPEGPGWEGDDYKIVLTSLEGEQLGEIPLYSTYGFFRIDLVDLTGDGVEEFVLITGEGRGTSCRKEKLTVIERFGDKFHGFGFRTILTTPISDFFGDGVRWWYEVHYQDVDNNGITGISLTLKHDPIGAGVIESPEVIPKISLRQFGWYEQLGAMVLIQEIPRTG